MTLRPLAYGEAGDATLLHTSAYFAEVLLILDSDAGSQ